MVRRLVDISRAGKMWELNEEGYHLGIMKQADSIQLTRRFGGYKKMRIAALGEIRENEHRGNKQTCSQDGRKYAKGNAKKRRDWV